MSSKIMQCLEHRNTDDTLTTRVKRRSLINTALAMGLCWLTLACSSLFSQPSHAIDLQEFKKLLSEGQAEVEVHGIDKVNSRYVVTARSKTDFFEFQHFALIGGNAEVWRKIVTLNRHDKIKIKGKLTSELRPFLHIMADSIEVTVPYSHEMGEYEYKVKLPDDLLGKSQLVAKIHAQHGEGRMFVADYMGTILPVLVPISQQAVAKKLSRGDIVRFDFEIRQKPSQITHLNLKSEAGSLEILEAVGSLHGKPVDYSGDLILFPKSPQVRFNVFAFKKEMPEGQTLEYTLVNFENPELFTSIRNKLQKAWDESKIEAKNDRNKLIKVGLKVRAKGIMNYQDPGQANPQVIINSLDDLSID